ncbi:MAG: sulfurtransferase [Euryarchaeota archaeon]|nr:sulfurtransferase [Euryarchaeota archaeon]
MVQQYAQQELVVSTDEAAALLHADNVRFVEVDVDTTAYEQGRIPGAVGWNWTTQLTDQTTRDIVAKKAFERLLGASGITPETKVVLYGDNNNWFAAYAVWLLRYYGHDDVVLIDGGRAKWIAEERETTTEPVQVEPATYEITKTRPELRATRDDVFALLQDDTPALVDVRSPDEYTGKVLAPPGLSETALRGGHIPGAINVPWSQAVQEDGTFKPPEALRALYADVLDRDGPVVAYCRIGERSSHTWFVLHHLLGVQDAKNYDGSWTEWGNLIGAPIRTGPEA